MPHELIKRQAAEAAVAAFFGSSQLSLVMDQTNSLSERSPQRDCRLLWQGA